MLDRFDGEYAHRLGRTTGSQLQAALDRFGLGTLTDVASVPGGVFGQDIFLTSKNGEFVLRGKPHYVWQFRKERFYAGLIHERTSVPAPWPYLIEESPDIFGWDFAIMPRLPGLQLADPKVRERLTPRERIEIAAAIGEGLAELHEVSWPECADNADREEAIPISTTYREWIASKVGKRVNMCRSGEYITEDDAAWCERLLRENQEALDVPFTPTLVHHDYKTGNLVVQEIGGHWRVSGVFDLMECYFADGEEDLVRLVLEEGEDLSFAKAFVRAYAALRYLRPGFRERFRIHTLRDCLLIWNFEHRRGAGETFDEPFQVWADRLVTRDPF